MAGDGQTAYDAYFARKSGADSIDDYRTVTKDEVVGVLDKASAGTGLLAAGAAVTPGAQGAAAVLGVVSAGLQGAALALDYSEERKNEALFDVATGGAGKFLKGAGETADAVSKTIDRIHVMKDSAEFVPDKEDRR